MFNIGSTSLQKINSYLNCFESTELVDIINNTCAKDKFKPCSSGCWNNCTEGYIKIK